MNRKTRGKKGLGIVAKCWKSRTQHSAFCFQLSIHRVIFGGMRSVFGQPLCVRIHVCGSKFGPSVLKLFSQTTSTVLSKN